MHLVTPLASPALHLWGIRWAGNRGAGWLGCGLIVAVCFEYSLKGPSSPPLLHHSTSTNVYFACFQFQQMRQANYPDKEPPAVADRGESRQAPGVSAVRNF